MQLKKPDSRLSDPRSRTPALHSLRSTSSCMRCSMSERVCMHCLLSYLALMLLLLAAASHSAQARACRSGQEAGKRGSKSSGPAAQRAYLQSL